MSWNEPWRSSVPNGASRTRRALAGVKPGTVLDHATAKLGIHRGAVVAAHIVQAAMVAHEHGPEFSNREYCEFWGVDERTGWLHRSEAKAVYGDAWREVVAALAVEMETRGVRSPAKATRLRFSVT